MATLTGKTLGGFLIEEELGRGAMGVVFKARQLSMDRCVAIKFLPKRLAQDEKVVARFHREARAAGQLSHPNVVSVHDVGCIDGLNYIAMEFVDGTSVHKRIKDKGPFSEKETLEIAQQMADALKYAHGRGILHRDIKPDNFLMDSSGRVRLADLGLARIISDEKDTAELTQDGTTMGTPHYMSPEQCKGVGVDHRSDLYSLGASMYVMASGKTPYEGNTAAAIMVKVLTEPPVSLKESNSDLSPGFISLVEKTMARDPQKRFQNAADLMEAIQKCKAGEYKAVTAPHARVTKSPTRPVQPPSKMKPLLMGAGAALLALIVIGALANGARKKDQPPADTTAQADTKKNDGATGTTNSGSASNSPATQPSPANTEAPKNTPPAAAGNTDERDDLPAHKEAAEQLRQIGFGIQRNPGEAIKRLDEFLKLPLPQKIKNRAQDHLLRARQQQENLAREWQALDAKSKQEIERKNYVGALFGLLAFNQAHQGTPEAAQAGNMIKEMVNTFKADNVKLADGGDIDQAIRNLNSAADKLPPEFADPLKAESQKLAQRQNAQKASADADQKDFALFYEKAQALAQKDVDSAGRKFLFNDAAKAMRDGGAKLRLESSKRDANAVAEVYAKAAATMDELRSEITKRTLTVPAFGNFNDVKLSAWTDSGIQYAVKEFRDQAQVLPNKSLTPKHIFQITDALKLGADNNNAPEAYRLGSIAFALGNELLARTKLEAASADPKLKPSCDAALKLLGPGDSNTREAQAAQIFKDAAAAKEKKDMDTVQKLSSRLTIDFADTDFVLSHAEQIHGLQLPAGAEKEKEKEKEKVAERPADGEAALAEIRKLGWSGVTGNWTQDATRKTLFTCKGGGELTYGSDVDIKVVVAPEEGGSVGIYYRYETDVSEPVRKFRREAMAWFEKRGLEPGLGYGVLVKGGEAQIYGARELMKGIQLPSKDSSVKVPPGPVGVALSARDGKLEINVQGAQPKRFNEPMRENGKTAIIIEGNARIEVPAVKK